MSDLPTSGRRRAPLAPMAAMRAPEVAGLALFTAETGTGYGGRPDLLLAAMPPRTAVAGRFSASRAPAEPVIWTRQRVRHGRAQGLVVNAGNANAYTGEAGPRLCEATAAAAAWQLGARPREIMLASTGVIGVPLAADALAAHMPDPRSRPPAGWAEAGTAIGTTDSFPKFAGGRARFGERRVQLCGLAKGTRAVHPDMATFLAFLFTDAPIAPDILSGLLGSAVDGVFNAMTIDGESSPADMALLFATGAAGGRPVTALDDPRLAGFTRLLDKVARRLAQLVLRDGEGVTRLVELELTGAANALAARKAGRAILRSALVREALGAGRADWGRILAALGHSGEDFDPDRLSLSIGGVPLVHPDGPVARPDLDGLARHLQGTRIEIALDLGLGPGRARLHGGDRATMGAGMEGDQDPGPEPDPRPVPDLHSSTENH